MSQEKSKSRIWLEMLPLICFFAMFKWQGIIPATAVLVVTTFMMLAVVYVMDKRVAYLPLFSAMIVGVFGMLTVVTDNDLFIKVKPTIINVLFAVILWGGLWLKKNPLKYVFSSGIEMHDKAWRIFTLRWSYFFIFMAVLNEYIWRNYTVDQWVQFKVFGIMGLSLLFILSQTPFLHKNSTIADTHD